jgi:hypothetical protein
MYDMSNKTAWLNKTITAPPTFMVVPREVIEFLKNLGRDYKVVGIG